MYIACLRSFQILSFLLFACGEEDLYKLLGVSRTATVQEIKSAYRRKAKDTHPDKNIGREEEAAKEFQKVVHAFDILSDKDSRHRYDRTGRADAQSQYSQQNSGGSRWSFTWNSRGSGGGTRFHYGHYQNQKPKLKDQFNVKESQSRIIHLASLDQLETIMVDETGALERNLLIAFFTPKLEQHLMDEMVYPYPFAAMSSQGIWWEDLLQTTTVRFHRSNKLTQFFNIPSGDTMEKPIFVFGKRGIAFNNETSEWSKLETDSRQTFDAWVWDQIKVQVEFVNHHDHAVEIYWIHGTTAKVKATLEPNGRTVHTTMLCHEWWVRDARTDTHKDSPNRYKLTENSMLIKWKIVSDEHNQQLIIPLRKCYDISGHCPFWWGHGECAKNPNFMREQCSKTCGLCTTDVDDPPEDESESDQSRDDEL